MAVTDGIDPPTTEHRRPAARAGAPFRFQGMQAGLVTRCAANVIDFIVTLVILGGIYVAFAALKFLWNPSSFTFPAPPLALAIIVGTWISGVYFAIAWMTTGRTYGDYVLGLRAVGRHGRRIRPMVAVLRAAMCVVFPIGILWVAVNRNNRSVQDIVLRTAVIYDWSEGVPQRG